MIHGSRRPHDWSEQEGMYSKLLQTNTNKGEKRRILHGRYVHNIRTQTTTRKNRWTNDAKFLGISDTSDTDS